MSLLLFCSPPPGFSSLNVCLTKFSSEDLTFKKIKKFFVNQQMSSSFSTTPLSLYIQLANIFVEVLFWISVECFCYHLFGGNKFKLKFITVSITKTLWGIVNSTCMNGLWSFCSLQLLFELYLYARDTTTYLFADIIWYWYVRKS